MNIVRLLEAPQTGRHQVDNLPDDVRFSSRELGQLAARNAGNAFRATAEPGDKPETYRVHLHPRQLGNAQAYAARPQRRDKLSYYDPELADLETHDRDDPYLMRTYARPKAHLSTTIAPLDDDNVMYRGMSFEEYQNFLRSGEIKSLGEYNLGGQEGLTYWTTDVQSAVTYANSFAPMQFKPAFGHPCFVVAAHRPDAHDVKRVKGTGEHELGVKRAVRADEVVAVWQGTVFDHESEAWHLAPVTSYDHLDRAVQADDTHRARYGGYSAQVVWTRIV